MSIDKFIVAEIKALHQSVGTGAITFSRMVEILNERMSKEVESAIQRAVEEAELKNKEYAQGFKDERDQWVNNWNHLDKLYQAQQSELTTLRTELERVRKCEAIMRECATADYYSLGQALVKARQWMKDNEPHQQTEGGEDNEN